MKLSKYLINTLKESPKEATIISHKLLLRASMIKQHSSGIYIWLPLGFKVLKNIEMLEIKQGPYNLIKDKIKFENVSDKIIKLRK